jgi:transglutaminase/protease-like cytokinesis protein 3
MSEIITDNMSIRDKIKAFHDYIVNTTVYDEERSNEIKNKIYNTNIFNSHKASGVLENHIALCSGYTDVMAVFLNIIGVKNYKISNNDHIWNAVNLG